MPYRQFTFTSVKKRFGLVSKRVMLFPLIEPMPPSNWLEETLKRTLKVAFVSEKARSEAIVMPILVELKEQNNDAFSIFSGVRLDADKERDLNGECDFVLSKSGENIEIEAPIFCLVEAKENDIEIGLGQCIAQMLGARVFNEQEGQNYPIIYGCVTTGENWQFLRLVGNEIEMDTTRYYLDRLDILLGVLQYIMNVG
jgi:hypothetical protein